MRQDRNEFEKPCPEADFFSLARPRPQPREAKVASCVKPMASAVRENETHGLWESPAVVRGPLSNLSDLSFPEIGLIIHTLQSVVRL